MAVADDPEALCNLSLEESSSNEGKSAHSHGREDTSIQPGSGVRVVGGLGVISARAPLSRGLGAGLSVGAGA